MEVFVKLKSVGKRRPILSDVAYVVPDDTGTLRRLIGAVVENEVERYNKKTAGEQLIPFLTQFQIEEASSVGKVGFGRLYSDAKANPEKAVATALTGFEDGLFKVLVGEREAVDLDAPLKIEAGDVITFIRLTFLAGRMW